MYLCFVYFISILFLIDRCTLSTSITMDDLLSHEYMPWIFSVLCLCSTGTSYASQLVYRSISYEQLVQPYQWFCWCRKIIIYLAISSISIQLVSLLTCRPIEIFYDVRYIIMTIVQVADFFVCLFFAFCLGVKYATIESQH